MLIVSILYNYVHLGYIIYKLQISLSSHLISNKIQKCHFLHRKLTNTIHQLRCEMNDTISLPEEVTICTCVHCWALLKDK